MVCPASSLIFSTPPTSPGLYRRVISDVGCKANHSKQVAQSLTPEADQRIMRTRKDLTSGDVGYPELA